MQAQMTVLGQLILEQKLDLQSERFVGKRPLRRQCPDCRAIGHYVSANAPSYRHAHSCPQYDMQADWSAQAFLAMPVQRRTEPRQLRVHIGLVRY